ncbi:hypothetical protein BDN72DRAFT_513121 [Pluteus cervinus]|uniref:Uncharacterized protein n=1 Tax=Pluteus cervinus TaxID=181527 RepID=A0ACD3BCP2_9AGAR|nr:hypothetical protein BDN72DRAFT_513121 [Pluteus cervinus]
MSEGQLPPTLLSTLQSSFRPDAIRPHSFHPFSSSADESFTVLQDLGHKINHISHSLSQYIPAPFTNPKLITQLREHASLSHQLHTSDQNISRLKEAFLKRPSVIFGEDIPLKPTLMVDWCISRLEAWGTSLGMETFKDDGRQGSVTLVLGGKVLVIDVDLSIDKSNPSFPRLRVASVKTSYANAQSTTGSFALDAFLSESIEAFCTEVQKAEESRDPEKAARLGAAVKDYLKYLVLLDGLATRQQDGGTRWFMDIEELYPTLQKLARDESEAIAQSLNVLRTPLDIFLHRAHSLPLLYLSAPSLSFLVYISPSTYLSLLKAPGPTQDDRFAIDISLGKLKSSLASSQKGVTLATLVLSGSPFQSSLSNSMPVPSIGGPTFNLAPRGNDIDHIFPQLSGPTLTLSPTTEHHCWILDFTDGGRQRGVVMNQTRMKEIELIINPLGGMSNIHAVPMMSFGTGSWIDLLINPQSGVSPERYTSLYVSPSGAHPPLQLRLTAPEEPGFILERVPVTALKEVWGILEVIREQCWLNEILLTCNWVTDGLQPEAEVTPEDSTATEQELEEILAGAASPRKIPVNVYLPNGAPDPLFIGTELDSLSTTNRRTRITMSSPERPPLSGLVEITVAYDEMQPRGLTVEIHGAMGRDVKISTLEEVCRRGGILGLAGIIWKKNSGSVVPPFFS